MNKVRVIKRSVGCQWLGICSLVPIIGLVFAVATILRCRSVRAEVGDDWNPARKQLLRGAILAWTGVVFTLLLLLTLTVRIWLESIARGS